MAALAGLANGIGVGVFRVHPLIMTLAVALVVEGLLLVYQRLVLGSSVELPEAITWLGSGRSFGNIPNALLVFIPLALFMGLLLRRTGFGRLLYAIGDNEGATRLAGVRYWQVIIVLYILAALLAGIGGLLYVGLIKANTLSLAVPLVLPSVAAAVIGGTSIFGGRGGYCGTIVGRPHPAGPGHAAARARRCRRAPAASSSGSSSWPSRRPTRASPRSAEAARHGGRHAPHRP